MELLEAQEYSNRPLFIMLVGYGPKTTMARAIAQSVNLPMSFIQIDNYCSENELLGSETDASIVVQHWKKMGSTDSVIVLKDFDKFVDNNLVNAHRLISNFVDSEFHDKFTTTYNISRSIIIAMAEDEYLPYEIVNRFHIIRTDNQYNDEQKKEIIKNILDEILNRYKINSYNLDISDETLSELVEEVELNGFKELEKNLDLLIAVHSSKLKKKVVQITIDDYYKVVFNQIKKEFKHGTLFNKLFEGFIEED